MWPCRMLCWWPLAIAATHEHIGPCVSSPFATPVTILWLVGTICYEEPLFLGGICSTTTISVGPCMEFAGSQFFILVLGKEGWCPLGARSPTALWTMWCALQSLYQVTQVNSEELGLKISTCLSIEVYLTYGSFAGIARLFTVLVKMKIRIRSAWGKHWLKRFKYVLSPLKSFGA